MSETFLDLYYANFKPIMGLVFFVISMDIINNYCLESD
jgi:hypothetical protein